jgi:CO/xanthine dehydrogenase FAD-binding subunit
MGGSSSLPRSSRLEAPKGLQPDSSPFSISYGGVEVSTEHYYLPRSVDEAIALLAEHSPALLVMAGGTIAMPLVNEGISLPVKAMGLRQSGLDYVRRSNGSLEIGATATVTQMLNQKEIPLLQQAAHHVGGWAIRNMATVGGNLFAPPPAGDFAVALLALDARVSLVGNKGERVLPLTEFYTGFLATALAPDELVTGINVPMPDGKTVYVKYGRRRSNTPAVVSLAVHLKFDGETVVDARLALNAVGPHPLRATKAERVLIGTALDPTVVAQAATAAAEECEPFTDAIASEWYRRKMVDVYVRRALAQLAG